MAWENWFLSRARINAKRHRRILLDDKMMFFQQLSSLISSGAPLLQALEVAAGQSQSDRLADVIHDVAGRVAAGCTLHHALAGHVGVFEPHWIAMISTGEASGRMDEVLNDLNDQIRESQAVRRKIIGSLTYPAVLLLVSIIVIIVMLWFVVPTFGDMFEEMNAELPAITQHVLSASDMVAVYGPGAAVGVVILAFLFRRYLQTDSGLSKFKAVVISLPVLGDLAVQAAMYRFASNLSLLLKSGVPILETLSVMANVFSRDPAYREAMHHARGRLAAGRSLGDALEETGLFTSMMINAVRIGEQSSRLGEVMDEIAPYYREKTNSFLAKATRLLEPCIIMGMGGTIAVVMLAIYVPMFEMAGKVH